jgi:hypothetical protein
MGAPHGERDQVKDYPNEMRFKPVTEKAIGSLAAQYGLFGIDTGHPTNGLRRSLALPGVRDQALCAFAGSSSSMTTAAASMSACAGRCELQHWNGPRVTP